MDVLKKQLILLVFYAFALLGIGGVFFTIDLSRLWQVTTRITLLEILLLLLVNVVIWLLNACRWTVLLEEQGCSAPLYSCFLHKISGFALSYITPGPQVGGEPLQAYLLHKHSNISLEIAASSVVMEKLINAIINVCALVVLSMVCWQTFFLSEASLYLPVVTTIFLLVVVFTIKHFSFPMELWMRLLPKNIVQRSQCIFKQLSQITFSRAWWCSTALAIGIWGLLLAEYWLCFYFLKLSLSFTELAFLLLSLHLSFAAPVPGGIGITESSLVVASITLGVDPAVALGVTALSRLRDLLFCCVGFIWVRQVMGKGVNVYHESNSPLVFSGEQCRDSRT